MAELVLHYYVGLLELGLVSPPTIAATTLTLPSSAFAIASTTIPFTSTTLTLTSTTIASPQRFPDGLLLWDGRNPNKCAVGDRHSNPRPRNGVRSDG